jgi:hypothetical protein
MLSKSPVISLKLYHLDNRQGSRQPTFSNEVVVRYKYTNLFRLGYPQPVSHDLTLIIITRASPTKRDSSMVPATVITLKYHYTTTIAIETLTVCDSQVLALYG